MIRSMTAYGRARDTIGGKDITAEIRSVNNRFFDCTVKISRMYGFLEDRVKAAIKSAGVSRGKLDVFVTVEPVATQGAAVLLDDPYTKSYLDALYRLRDEYGLKDDISVMQVAQNRDIFAVTRPAEDMEADWHDVETVLKQALDAFLAMREAEGRRMADDIKEKKAFLVRTLPEIEAASAQDKSAYFGRLEERLRSVLEERGVAADDSRVLTECAIFADKIAVDEETVRLRSHFAAFDEMLTSEEPVGRKLDFLLQEMNRETNTIGSKCSDLEITRRVIAMKNELEKIREQIQNIE